MARGQLPRNVTVRVMQGTADITGGATISTTATAGISAAYDASIWAIVVSDATNDGVVTVSASHGGTDLGQRKISVVRAIDAAPASPSTSASALDYLSMTSTAYGSADGHVLSLPSSASGVMNFTAFTSYDGVGAQTNGQRLTVALLNALNLTDKKKRFPFATAEATLTGEALSAVLARFEVGMNASAAENARIEAVSQKAKRDIKAAPTAAAKRAAYAAINRNWSAN